MKTKILSIIIIILNAVIISQAQTRFSSETTLSYDKLQGGIPLNRFEITNSSFSVKYDYKVDLINGKTVNDVFGIFFPKIINKPTFSLDGALIKLGDWNNNDQLIFDLAATKKLGPLTVSLEIGRAIGVKITPWDYVLSRVSHRLFTIESGVLSDDHLFALSQKKLYGWIAFHPKHFYIATGNEISRNWFFFGTKQYKNFGSFTCADYDRDNGNFWFRSQFGFIDANQKFYSQENYIIATSYLNVPPFFYRHFSPMSTKGKYTLKLDGKRVGKLETYEITTGRQFGKYGQIAIGLNNENFNKKRVGLILEYYKEFTLKNFKASAELRYQQLDSRFYGFITLSYQF